MAGPTWTRPWYQSRTAVLAAAIVPPVLVVALVQFAKGGYLLAYLPAAVIALLLPLGALNRRASGGSGSSTVWLTVTSIVRRGHRRARRTAVPRWGRGAPRALGDVVRAPLARPAPVPGALHRHPAHHPGRRRHRLGVARPRSVGVSPPRRGGVRHRRRRSEHLPERRVGAPRRPRRSDPARCGSSTTSSRAPCTTPRATTIDVGRPVPSFSSPLRRCPGWPPWSPRAAPGRWPLRSRSVATGSGASVRARASSGSGWWPPSVPGRWAPGSDATGFRSL